MQKTYGDIDTTININEIFKVEKELNNVGLLNHLGKL